MKFKKGDWVKVVRSTYETIKVGEIKKVISADKIGCFLKNPRGLALYFPHDELIASYKHENLNTINEFLGIKDE